MTLDVVGAERLFDPRWMKRSESVQRRHRLPDTLPRVVRVEHQLSSRSDRLSRGCILTRIESADLHLYCTEPGALVRLHLRCDAVRGRAARVIASTGVCRN